MKRHASLPPALLPWWGFLILGGIIWLLTWMVAPWAVQRDYAQGPLILALRIALTAGLHKTVGGMGMLLCVLAALVSWFRGGERRRLLDKQRDLATLRELDWKEFERLVGEAYRRRGYRIVETGQGGADGGIDLLLWKNNRKTLVQVKQWRSSSVGAPVVREMLGLMMHHKADAGAIVCVGRFTREAWKFADGKPISLIGGQRLLEMIKSVQGGKTTTTATQGQ